MKQSKEQKLVDICFEIGITIHSNIESFSMTKEELAEWIAKQLRECGFNTKPCGASWGVLVKE